jgi:hypothetical protein
MKELFKLHAFFMETMHATTISILILKCLKIGFELIIYGRVMDHFCFGFITKSCTFQARPYPHAFLRLCAL